MLREKSIGWKLVVLWKDQSEVRAPLNLPKDN